MTAYILNTDAAEEPITLTEVKTALRIDGTDYDSILTPYITTARQMAEAITGRDFVNKTWKLYLDKFPRSSCSGIEIKKSKLQSISSIKYYIDNELTTLSSSSFYKTEDSEYSSIYLISTEYWPIIDDRKQAIEITLVSGYGADASYVPQGIKTALISMVTWLFENAGDCTEDNKTQFNRLLQPYILANIMIGVC